MLSLVGPAMNLVSGVLGVPLQGEVMVASGCYQPCWGRERYGTQRSLGAEFASVLTLEMLYVIVFDPPTSVLVSQLAEWQLDGGT